MVCFSLVSSYHVASAQIVESRVRKAIFDTLRTYANVTIEIGWNRHPNIIRFNKAAKIGLTQPYCASYLLYGYHANMIFLPLVTPSAYSWKKRNRLVFYPAMLKDLEQAKQRLKLMDVVVMTWSHVEGYVDIDIKRREIITIAGNTRGGRRTEGCYYPIRRNLLYIHGIYNHISNYVQLHEAELNKQMSF